MPDWPPRITFARAAGRLLAVACGFALLTGVLLAEESEVSRVAAPSGEILPAVFTKELPETVADLEALQRHVESLVGHLTECTVAVQVRHAQGSGVIVSEDGYVLTAAHVSGRPGRKATFTLPDGREVTGRTLGHNHTLDASLLKIDEEGTKWPFAEMARPSDVHVGDWCIATGHPGGYQEERAPVVRLGRVIFVDERDIRTDCELVGGDSGGPLFDMRGRVIGINSRIGANTSLNLHVPIRSYRDYWDRLLASESFRLHSGAYLGVRGESDAQGLRLTEIIPEKPAAEAGLQEGDILLSFQGSRVWSIEQLKELVGQERPGSRVTLQVVRNGETLRYRIRLGVMDSE